MDVDPWATRRLFPSKHLQLAAWQEVNVLLAATSVMFGVMTLAHVIVWRAFLPAVAVTAASLWLTPPLCRDCRQLTKLKARLSWDHEASWLAVCGACGTAIPRRFDVPPVTGRDVTIFVFATGLAATLGVLVHPLFWAIVVLAIAWLLGRDRSTASERQGPEERK